MTTATSNETRITAPDGLPYIDIQREFDGPPELVFRAYTEPELLKQWLGPRQYEMVIDHWESRAGGSYRYEHRDDQGNVYGFHGVFHSLAPENMVQTFEFEGAPGHVSLDRLTLEDLGNGRTRAHTHSVFQSLEARDAMIEAGMSGGVIDGYLRLDELLPRIR